MKILQINSHFNHGGAARIVACIHKQILREGEKSYVAYGRGEKSVSPEVYRFNFPAEVYASALASRVIGIHGWSNEAATTRLLKFMEKVKPDIIHMHALHGYYINLPVLFRYINEKKIPCVWTHHDCFAFTGNCGYFFECDRWKTGCGNCPDIHTYPKSQWFDKTNWMWRQKKELFVKNDKKIMVTPSDWLTGEVKKSFLGSYECITIHNGIDIKGTFYPREKLACRKKYGYEPKEKLLLGIAVGYDDVRKGAKYMIQLAKDLEQEAKVILIGWKEKNNNMLENTQNVITLPSTSSADMLAEYYSMADVFVLPSLAENYATTALESMACGTPVVGFAAGGIPEQMTEGRGIAVPIGDQEALNEAVRRAMSKESGLLGGLALAEKTQRENSMERMTEEYLKIYRRLLEE